MKFITMLMLLFVNLNSNAIFFIDDKAGDPYETVEELADNKLSIVTVYETNIISLNGCMRAQTRAKRVSKEICLEEFDNCEMISSGIKGTPYPATAADENFYLTTDPGSCSYEVVYQGILNH